MPDPTILLIDDVFGTVRAAQELKYRQRYFAAMTLFLKAEALIVEHLPKDQRAAAMTPAGLAPNAMAPAIPVELGRFYFADVPLGIGDCLVQIGQDFERALTYYGRAQTYPFTNPPLRDGRSLVEARGGSSCEGRRGLSVGRSCQGTRELRARRPRPRCSTYLAPLS